MEPSCVQKLFHVLDRPSEMARNFLGRPAAAVCEHQSRDLSSQVAVDAVPTIAIELLQDLVLAQRIVS